ncbi:MAG: hypothetical protein PHH60_02910 [Candidatus Margulisbacteria bacterium]|nr:hypothetical protein [Candidatus Margulisiibacteriota bacterium]
MNTLRVSANGLSGRNLYGFLYSQRVRVIGLNPDHLRDVAFRLDQLGVKLGQKRNVTMFFPPDITGQQIKEVFEADGLPDVKIDAAGDVIISLQTLNALASPVIGRPETTARVLLTAGARAVLDRASLIVIGEDANLEIFSSSEKLGQLASQGPLVLGTTFSLENLPSAVEKINDPADINFIIRRFRDELPTLEPLLKRLAELCPDGMLDSTAAVLEELAFSLTENDLILLLNELKVRDNLEAFAHIEQRLDAPAKKVALFIARTYGELGCRPDGLKVLGRIPQEKKAPPPGKAKKAKAADEVKKLAAQLKRAEALEKKEREKQTEERRARTIEAFNKLQKGELSAADFVYNSPADVQTVLADYVTRNIRAEIYSTLRRYAREGSAAEDKALIWLGQACQYLLDLFISEVYLRVVDARLTAGGYVRSQLGQLYMPSSEENVLDAILSDLTSDDLLPAAELLPKIEKRALNKDRPYMPALRLFDKIFLVHCHTAHEAAEKKDYEASWRSLQRADVVYPQNKGLHEDMANLLFEWGRQLYKEKNAPAAVAKFEQVLEYNPNHKQALIILTYQYSTSRDYAKVIPLAERVLKQEPGNVEILNMLGFNYLLRYRDSKDAADLELARGALEKCRRLDPAYPRSLYNLALVYAEFGDFERVFNLLAAWLGEQHDLTPVFALFDTLFQSYEREKISGDKLNTLVEKIELEGRGKTELVQIVNFAGELFESGFAAASEALAGRLGGTLAAYVRGISCYRGGEYGQAVDHLKSVIEEEGYEVLNNFLEETVPMGLEAANTYLVALKMTAPELVAAEAERLTAKYPSAALFNNLGNIYEDEEPQKAIEYFRKARQLRPLFILPILNLLSTYRGLGDWTAYGRTLEELADGVHQAAAQGKRRQFEYKNMYLMLLEEKSEVGEQHAAQIDAILKFLARNFKEAFAAAVIEYCQDHPSAARPSLE